MNNILRLVRYNTGNDKKIFIDFKNNFNAILMNATIVAYSGSAIADLVTVHKNKYIIDPQTHIFQQEISALTSTNKKGETSLKKSIEKYIDSLPNFFSESLKKGKNIAAQEVLNRLSDLVQSVSDFQLKYVKSFIEKKEYNKYLEFLNEDSSPKPKLLIAPYFMIKKEYDKNEIDLWMHVNEKAIKLFVEKVASLGYPISAQLVLDKDVLERLDLDLILQSYKDISFEYVFIWIDDFIPLTAPIKQKKAFFELIVGLNSINKKPIMAYGGYDSIILCHEQSKARLYGVAHSVGYGEARQITPVGGGLPVNKYYLYPIHQRLRMDEIFTIMYQKGYFDSKIDTEERAEKYYKELCSCPQCKKIIKDDIDEFQQFNDSIPFTMKNGIRRNRPTSDASYISAKHFMFSKESEWEGLYKFSYDELLNQYESGIKNYNSSLLCAFGEWKKFYG